MDACWIEGINERDQPIWALAKCLSHTCWYLVSRKLKAAAALATLGGLFLFPLDSLHAQTGIDLNKLTGTNGFTLKGVDPGDQAGQSVASGDINGDGIEDVIIGALYGDAHLNGSSEAGETYVVFGKSTAFPETLELSSLDGNAGFIIHGIDGGTGPFAGDRSGQAVASGDINGDGYDDVIIGAHFGDPNERNAAGETYVIFGQNSFSSILELSSLPGSAGFVIHGVDGGVGAFSGDRSGWAVSSGDINGDTYDDVIIGAPFRYGVDSRWHDGEAAYVVFGFDNAATPIDTVELSSLDGTDGFTFGPGAGYSYFGWSVGNGDINGDGYEDVIIGAPGIDYYETYVVFGSPTAFASTVKRTSLDGNTGFTLKGINKSDDIGTAVTSGDINGDGMDDVIIGAYRANPNGARTAGETYVVFGFDDVSTATLELSSLDGNTGFVLRGIDALDRSGKALATGDINGDGTDDIIIGAHFATPNDNLSGETYVVFGKSTAFASAVNLSSLDGSTGFVLNGIGTNSQSGWAVSTGDINGDGKDDVIIGANFANAGDENLDKVGEVYVFTQFPAAAKLGGSEGLRMLAAPASGTILDEFLEPFWTQGMAGADTPNGDSNLWVWDENAGAEGSWTAVSDLSSQQIIRGQGFLMHVFSDDNYDGTPEGFPKMLTTIDIFNSAVVDTGTVTPVSNLGDGRFFLVGNPYPSTFDWDSDSVVKSNLSNSIYIWDDASGQYQTWNGTQGAGNITEGRIAPFQSFFIQALDETGKLVIGEAARTDSSGTFFKQLPVREPRLLSIQAEAGDNKAEAWLSFQEGGQLDRDAYDALYLQPFTTEFLKLGAVLSSEEVLQINALPVDLAEELVIPLDLSGTVTATHATFSVTGLEAFEGWEFALRDTHTGEDFIIDSETSLELEIESIKAKLKQPLLPKPIPTKAKAAGSRYQMVVTPAPPVHNEPDPGIPSAIELQQNYPNPFNPGTVIEFGVPAQGDVRLEVFDMLGRKVAELLNGPMQPGRYRVNFDASALSSGMYIYRLQTGNTSLAQKMTLIK